jgi:sugar phosphate isomerase/epimerase
MIDFGMPTLIETKTLEECARLCQELGLQFIELNMNLPQYQSDKIDAAYFAETAEKNGIYYTIHLDENLNVSDFNIKVAEAYRQTVLETIKLAKKLSVPVLNMHLSKGVYFTLPERRVYLFDEYKDTYLAGMEMFRYECEKLIGETNIKICIENSDGYTDFQKEALSLLLESPVFGLTFDIGHNHGIGGMDEPVIMERVDRLCHMHMHDAIGEKNHLALGTGEIDLRKYLGIAAEHNCRVVLETKTIEGLQKSVDWVKKRGVM